MDNEGITERIILKDGREIVLIMSDGQDRVDAFNAGGDLIGGFEFRDEDEPNVNAYKLTHMDLERTRDYKRCGIGTAILKFFKKVTGAVIWCENPFDQTKRNGHEIIGEGVIFVQRMKELGLLNYEEENPNDQV